MTLLLLISNSGLITVHAKEETVITAIGPDIIAPNAIIINAESGTELYAKSADEAIFCGFLPRLMTCVLLLESGLDLQSQITVTREMMSISHDKSSAGLVSGNVITLFDVLQCIIVGNSQEACIIAAYAVSGNVTDFIVDMNLRARELGANNTVFTSVTGQYNESTKQSTTVRDIASIAAHSLTLEYIEELSNKRYIEITISGRRTSLFTKNSLVYRNSTYYSKKASGLAISGSQTQGFVLVSVAVDKTMRLISVAVNHSSVAELYADITCMLDYSLKEYSNRILVRKSAPVCEIPVTYGKERDTLTLVADSTITLSMPSSVPDSAVSSSVNIPDGITAPVTKGSVLGSITFFYEGKECGSTELTAQSDISLDIVASYTGGLQEFFSNKYLWATIIVVVTVILVYSLTAYILNRKKIKREQRRKRSRIKREP